MNNNNCETTELLSEYSELLYKTKNDLNYLVSLINNKKNLMEYKKTWESIPCLLNADFLNDDEKKNIFDVLFYYSPDEHNYFYLSSLNLSSEDKNDKLFKSDILKIAFKNKKIKHFSFDVGIISNKSIQYIYEFLKDLQIEEISFLNFSDFIKNKLFFNFFKNSKNIKTLCVEDTCLDINNIENLVNCLIENNTLKNLKFYGFKQIENEHLNFLATLIKNTSIVDINLFEIGNHKKLMNLLIKNFFINKEVNFKFYNKRMNKNIKLITDIIEIEKPNYFKEITLPFNELKSSRFTILVESLIKNKNENILSIDISHNYLDNDCIEPLCKLIEINKYICDIDLSCNKIKDEGIYKLSEYMINNLSSIKSICICGNSRIGNNSVESLKNILKKSYVTKLCFSGTKIDDEKKEELENLLEVPFDDRELPLITINEVKSASKRMKE